MMENFNELAAFALVAKQGIQHFFRQHIGLTP